MNIQKRTVGLVALTIAFVSSWASAGQEGYGGHYFKSLRDDLTVPEKCRDVDLSHFSNYDLETFTYGPIGAHNRGFTHEYPIRRKDAKTLWHLAQRLVSGEDHDELERRYRDQVQLLRDFRLLASHFEDMGFNFASEGEVLEILAILDLSQNLSSDFYVYGSVYYNDKVAGELDLMVGHRSSCQIVSIGEAKLGLKSLSKAHRQLDRFKGFLKTHLHNLLNPFDLRKYSR